MNDVLSTAREQFHAEVMERAEKNFERRWSRIEPIISGYLEGKRVTELARKSGMNRTNIYVLLKRYSIPRVPSTQACKLANKLAYRASWRETVKELRKHGCPLALQVADMIEQTRRG